MRFAGYVVRSWWVELKQLTTAKLYIVSALIVPLIFASIAHYVFQGSPRNESALALALSAGLMGMWSSVLLGSGNSIDRYRWMGILETLVASPTPTFVIILPFALASASLGLYSLVATLAWSALLFGAPVLPAEPALFVIALVVTIVALGLLGMLLASAFILYPTANALANVLEYPVWMFSGMLVPISMLAEPLRWLSYVLAPTWGVRAVTGAGTGTGSVVPAILCCLGLSVCYGLATAILLRRFEWMARGKGTLSLT